MAGDRRQGFGGGRGEAWFGEEEVEFGGHVAAKDAAELDSGLVLHIGRWSGAHKGYGEEMQYTYTNNEKHTSKQRPRDRM